jgi:N-acetylneuraminate lyase
MKGIYAALLGVFDDAHAPNEDGVRALVRHNIEACRVDGLYVNGSTGESMLLTADAKKRVFRAAAEEARGDVSLIAHVGSNVLEEVVALAECVAPMGYDAVSAVTPFYYKFTAEEIKDYYRAIARASKLPVLAYYIPQLSGVTLPLRDLSDLLRIDNVMGVKFTSNDLFLLEQLRAEWPDKLIFSGYDEMLLSASVLGTDGAIGSTYNIIGHWAKAVFGAVQTGDLARARAVQHHMNRVIASLISAGLYATIKEVTKLYGVPAGRCKPPMADTTPDQAAAAREIFEYIRSTDAALGL